MPPICRDGQNEGQPLGPPFCSATKAETSNRHTESRPQPPQPPQPQPPQPRAQPLQPWHPPQPRQPRAAQPLQPPWPHPPWPHPPLASCMPRRCVPVFSLSKIRKSTSSRPRFLPLREQLSMPCFLGIFYSGPTIPLTRRPPADNAPATPNTVTAFVRLLRFEAGFMRHRGDLLKGCTCSTIAGLSAVCERATWSWGPEWGRSTKPFQIHNSPSAF